MIDEETVIKVLYDLTVASKTDKSLTKKSIANRYHISRGTVYSIIRDYKFSDQEIIAYYEQIKTNDAPSSKGSHRYFFKRTRTNKVKKDDIEVIKKCCITYLNCYLTAEIFLNKLIKYYQLTEYKSLLCDRKLSKLDIIQAFDDQNNSILGLSDYSLRQKYEQAERVYSNIKLLKRYKKPPKNFQEVFDEYKKTDSWTRIQIKYNCFLGYAKKYWNDNAMDYWREIQSANVNFGYYIYQNYYYDDKVDKIIKK